MKLSRYTYLFSRDGVDLLYSSRSNNFYKIPHEFFKTLNRIEEVDETVFSKNEREAVQTLCNSKIIVDGEEDDFYLDELHMAYLMSSMNRSNMGLTILPTIQCNLGCPYCFEGQKRSGIMDETTADCIIEFIKRHQHAMAFSICWFGGEPLLGINIMQYLLDQLSEIDKLKMTYHTLVTNGTLLNEKAIGLFKRHPLDSIQITFDGLKDAHDSKRFFTIGKNGSFDLILSNLDKFVKEFPDTNVSLRFNVDKSNSSDFRLFDEFISQRYANAKVSTYPALLRKTEGCSAYNYFTMADSVKFHRTLRNQNGIQNWFPTHQRKGCTATNASSYVIGPKGELYRCWEHVGKDEKVIGNVRDNRYSNQRLYVNFLMNGHPFNDPKCRKCGMLPICTGGCPDKRLSAIGCKGDTNLCDILNHNNGHAIEDFLYDYYLTLNTDQS